MKYYVLIILLCFVFAGCQIKSPKIVDADTVVKNLTNNNMYKKFSGMYIISRYPGGFIYYLGIDSLGLEPVVKYFEGEIILDDQMFNYLKDTLELKYHLDSKKYIEKFEQRSAELINFMLQNGIFSIYAGNKGVQLSLNNEESIFLCKDDEKNKEYLYESYTVIKIIDSCWYVMRDKKKK